MAVDACGQCCGSGSVWIRFIWPDPDLYGSISFGRIRIRFRRSGSGSRSQISQKLFIFEQNFNKCKDENAKFLLNVQGFEYLRRFLIDKGNPQNFSFQKKAKKFRNFEFLSRFGQDSDPGSGSAFGFVSDPDPDP